MKLFDLHCDTPYELYRKKCRLLKNDLHVSLDKARVFTKYVQCAAIWCNDKKSDAECLCDFKSIKDYFQKEADGLLVSAKKELECSGRDAFILTVEDSRLVDSDVDNLKYLYGCGVRVLTLLWGGESSVGGAWNTEGSLTSLGKDILDGCFDTGIIPDLSHAGDKVCLYVIERARERHLPVIATHSNSRTVHPHRRNLSDDIAKSIAHHGGIIGISLYPPHLRGEKAEICDIIDHINYFLSILGTQSVCLGCDLDGIGETPEGINSLGDLPRLWDALSKSCGSSAADGVFYNNAYNFFINNLP